MNRNTNPALRNAPRSVDERARTLSGRGITAVLGPTNTGKTHLAIERMVAHSSGVIGLPLRLLAREVYGRVAAKVGERNVALITGEEKIQPANARFRVCTVEAMPAGVDAAFVAIDEVQLAANLERGHVFTDRLMNLRGREETMLLGAATLRPALEALLPGIDVVTRPRMSMLTYQGSKKITRLPRRSAIVAFSADEVYAIAELIRRQRGAAAVVLGSLSPRTRNAQVELYQSGDVDYLVATDAIGMGLNLDVDHVAFAQDHKFDGYQNRRLTPAEMAQIAGRAGRHTRDGTFGVTGNTDPFEDELVQRLETHSFAPVRSIQWRNRDLVYDSVDHLLRSLDRPAPLVEHRTGGLNGPVLTKAPQATDQRALEFMIRDGGVGDRATSRERVELLWNVAQIPDYPRVAPAAHAEILANIYKDICDLGHVDENWLREQVARTDDATGDIDALSNRIAHIRTWTFVSQKSEWLDDPVAWAAETRAIEDRLSDALHERLTKRFVDRRTSVLMRRLRENAHLEAEVDAKGAVTVEGHAVGELQGFRFSADTGDGPDQKATRAAAAKALAPEIERRATRLGASANGDFTLALDGTLRWQGAPVGRLAAGDDVLRPRVIVLADEALTGTARDRVQARLDRWLAHRVDTLLKPLVDLHTAVNASDGPLAGAARGLAFRLTETMGALARADVADDVRAVEGEARAALRRLGVRFGEYHVFLPALLKPAPAELATLLWALKNDRQDAPGYGDVPRALGQGRTSFDAGPGWDERMVMIGGFRLMGTKAVRLDILERLADLIRPATQWKPDGNGKRAAGAFARGAFFVTPAMLSILGARVDDMPPILKALGYRGEPKTVARVREVIEGAGARAPEAKATQKAAPADAPMDAAAEPAEASAPVQTNEAPGQTNETTETVEAPERTETALADGGLETVTPEPVQEAANEAVAADAPSETPTEAEPVAVEPAAQAEPQPEAKGSAKAADTPPAELALPRTEDDAPADTVLIWRRGGARRDRPAHRDARGRRPESKRQARPNGRDGAKPGGTDGVKTGETDGAAADGAGRKRDGARPGKRPGRGPEDRDGDQREGAKRNGPKRAGPKRPGPKRSGPKREGEERRTFRAAPPAAKRREKQADPDSPFAALAALKDRLK